MERVGRKDSVRIWIIVTPDDRAETETVRGSTGETAFHQSTVSSGADMIREDNTPLNLAQLSTNIHMANIFLVAGDACTLNSSQRWEPGWEDNSDTVWPLSLLPGSHWQNSPNIGWHGIKARLGVSSEYLAWLLEIFLPRDLNPSCQRLRYKTLSSNMFISC